MIADLAGCVSILSNICAAMSSSARLVILEIVVSAKSRPHIGPLIDLNMMAMTGGRERTEAEYCDLLSKSGLCLRRILPAKSPSSVIGAVQ